jgi:hypothetical protein
MLPQNSHVSTHAHKHQGTHSMEDQNCPQVKVTNGCTLDTESCIISAGVLGAFHNTVEY